MHNTSNRHTKSFQREWTVIDLTFVIMGEGSGSVVECLTRDRRAAGSSLTGVTALCPLARTFILA